MLDMVLEAITTGLTLGVFFCCIVIPMLVLIKIIEWL